MPLFYSSCLTNYIVILVTLVSNCGGSICQLAGQQKTAKTHFFPHSSNNYSKQTYQNLKHLKQVFVVWVWGVWFGVLGWFFFFGIWFFVVVVLLVWVGFFFINILVNYTIAHCSLSATTYLERWQT